MARASAQTATATSSKAHMPQSASALLPRICRADDVYAQSRALSAWEQLYDQLHPGEFNGSLEEVVLDGMHLCHEQTNLSLLQHCLFTDDAVWIGVPSANSAPSFINHAPVSCDQLALASGGRTFELLTPAAFSIAGMVITRAGFAQGGCVGGEFEQLQGWAAQQSVLGVGASHVWRLGQRLRDIVTQHVATACPTPGMVNSIQDEVFDLLLGVLAVLTPPVDTPRQRAISQRKLVSSAREYVLAHAADPISVLDLCREFYVSRRTLQNIFTQVLGVGPNAWLKMVRLNAVRRELLNPTSKHFTVKDAAMHWGFWHLSQFAMDYQQFFKELPSMTRQLRGQRAH